MADDVFALLHRAATSYEINRLKAAIPWPPLDIDPLLPIGYNAQSRAATKFSGFRKVPIELRLMIWREAIPDKRLVEIRWSEKIGRWWSPSIPPALFYTTRESRDVIKIIYSKLTISFDNGGPNPIYTWINYERETLYMCPTGYGYNIFALMGLFFKKLQELSILSELQSLALEFRFSDHILTRWLCAFRKLARIDLVFSDVCVDELQPMTEDYIPVRKIDHFKDRSSGDRIALRWDATIGAQGNLSLSAWDTPAAVCSRKFKRISRYWADRHTNRGGLEVCAIDIIRA